MCGEPATRWATPEVTLMEPRIQYAKTEDGVNIAFSTLGEGRGLLLSPPMLFSHLTLEWQSL